MLYQGKDFLAANQDVRSPISTGEFINLPAGKPSNDRPDVADVSLRRLRTALRNGWISFPSPVPVFIRQSRPEIQWRLVPLYFVSGWACTQLASRYRVTPDRARQLLSQWVRRAVLLGYLQQIPAADAAAAGYGLDT